MPDQQRIRVKVCLVGDCGVGKSSLVKRLTQDTFDEKYLPTAGTKVTGIEFEFPEKHGETVLLEMDIWDISGQRSFLKFLKRDYFRKARMIVAVCDVSRSETLHNLERWIQDAREISGDVPIQIVANKSDSLHNLIKYDPLAKKLSNDYESSVIYVSTSTGQNVDFVFQEIASKALEYIMRGLTHEEEILEVEWEILGAIVKRGKLGASKEFFFQNVRGISFDTLKANIESLERKGYLQVNWNGTSDFLAKATDEGFKKAETGPKKFDDEFLDLVTA
jgi:small GTP-binding protein